MSTSGTSDSDQVMTDQTSTSNTEGFSLPHSLIQKKRYDETEDEEKLRFEMELEFVQLLGHPSYVQFLAQYKYFEDAGFLEYLKYLQYWKAPEYAKFIKFPYSLFVLDRVVNDEHFREDCKTNAFRDMLHQQIISHWSFYRKNREEKILKNSSFDFEEESK